jgi:hypothetical protein
LASAIPSSPAGAALSTEDAAALKDLGPIIEQIKNEAAANKK